MAVRLNVIVLRPAGPFRHFDPACDDAVGQLLGRPGLDLVLLDRIPAPEETGTERLAVESVAGDVACVAWTDADSVSVPLGLLGKRVSRVPHRRDPDVVVAESETPIAKLYHFDMRADGASSTILADLQALLATRQTPTFQINLGGAPEKSKPPTLPKAPAMASPVRPMVQPVVSPAEKTPTVVNRVTDLDALVDELDELDL